MRKVTVLAWDLSHNAAARGWLLADVLRRAGCDADLAGPQLLGSALWMPLRGGAVPTQAIPGKGWDFIRETTEFVRSHPRDTVIVSKPRFPSMLAGLLYKKLWGARVIVDVDDWELAFGKGRTPIDPRRFDAPSAQVDLSSPWNSFWTQVAEGMMELADAVTVSNVMLKERFGGTIVRHARDERVFDRGLYDDQAMRRKHNLPAEGRMVMFLGTARRHKGLDDILRFMLDSGAGDLRLCVLNAFEDKSYRQELCDAAGDRLLVLPPKPFGQLPELLSTASFVCLPQAGSSDVAAYQIPAKLTDAMAMRVPVMISPIPPVADLMGRGLFLNDGPLDAAAFAQAVALPPAVLREHADRAHRCFMEEFSYQASAQALGRCLVEPPAGPVPEWTDALLALARRIKPGAAPE